MPRVVVGRGRRPPTVSQRRRKAHDALVAAGEIAVPNFDYDLTQGSLARRRFYELVLATGKTEVVDDRWPCESQLGDVPGVVFRDGETAVLHKDGVFTLVSLSYGWLNIEVGSNDKADSAAMCSAFRQAYPASYLIEPADGQRVPITFWSYSRMGPYPRLRKIESASWADIENNYTAAVKTELAALMAWDEPPDTGQLILWQGPPGTGKSWALRCLATEWASWSEFHYITDPDSFFVTDPSYMVDVLLSDSYATIDRVDGGVYEEQDPLGKWRILILEDTGELLAANAKESYGQGLSRLLNVVDGMIGQGLRVLALVTTNDELGDLHPAVARPGRCASQIEFGPLTAEEASVWLGYETGDGGTVAELYARNRVGAEAIPEAAEEREPETEASDIDALLDLARAPLLSNS